MSLIIARKFGSDIFLISDTLLTEVNDDKLSTSLENHILKIVVINSQLVFGFSGSVEDAEETLKKIDENQTVEEIKSILYTDHCKSIKNGSYSVEFILATGVPNFELVEFKNGSLNNVLTSWLGSFSGFELFQNYMFNKTKTEPTPSKSIEKSNKTNDFEGVKLSMNFYPVLLPLNEARTNQTYSENYSKALVAMNKVIESGTIREVGGFYLPVAYRNGEYTYMHYSAVFSAEQLIPITSEKTSKVISFGTPQDGSYTISLLPQKDTNGRTHATFHFLHGELGLIYERQLNGLPKPIIYPNADSIDFSFILKNRFSMKEPPIVSIGFSLDNFGINAEKYIDLGKNEIALERLDWGIIKCQKDSKLWKLYKTKAILHFKMKDYIATINDLEQLQSIAPESEFVLIYSYRADSFSFLKRYRQAIACYSEVLRMNAKHKTTYYNRSLCYYKLALSNKSKDILVLAKIDLIEAEKLGCNPQQTMNLNSLINQFEMTF